MFLKCNGSFHAVKGQTSLSLPWSINLNLYRPIIAFFSTFAQSFTLWGNKGLTRDFLLSPDLYFPSFLSLFPSKGKRTTPGEIPFLGAYVWSSGYHLILAMCYLCCCWIRSQQPSSWGALSTKAKDSSFHQAWIVSRVKSSIHIDISAQRWHLSPQKGRHLWAWYDFFSPPK